MSPAVIASREAILLALVAAPDGLRAPGNLAMKAQEIADAACSVFGHALVHGFGHSTTADGTPTCARCGRPISAPGGGR